MAGPILYPELAVASAVADLRHATAHLRAAVYSLDDGGFRCTALNDLASSSAALLADWRGHVVPDLTNETPAFIASAREWRRTKLRSY